MNITLEKNSSVNATLKVALTEADYKEKVDKTLKDYRKRANIKGFRPGMVPMPLVQKMFGKSVLAEEINNILSSSVSEYIKENKLNIVGDPLPAREDQDAIDWDADKEFNFSYELGLAGEFEIDFAKLPTVTSYEIKAGDKELEDTIQNLKGQFGEQIHPEAVEAGDMVFGTFKQGEWVEKSAIPLKAVKEDALSVFVGAQKDDVLKFDIQSVFVDEKSLALATGKKVEEVAALQGEVEFTVEDITRQVASELTQEFFDKVLGKDKVASEEEFRTQVLEIVQSNYKREAEYLLRIDAEKAILENTSIELPEEFLRKWLIAINEGKFTPEQIDADFENVKRDLRWTLIKNEIADKHEVKVDYPEVVEKAKDMVRSQFGFQGGAEMENGMEEMIEKIATGYLTDKSKSDNFMNMFNQVYADKISNVILENIKADTKVVDVEEFKSVIGA
ncbi:trigger factor [Pseudarcicella hirudinis]|uniref:Trigger factor n=1 Tax=Pseudarcicella hirudinis TaxID=1079859 RepID=A0A1I5P1Z8_9BACT|nr:trigger factor [Pseudarcicella hirudinis]SFP27561.1 trigger factor [Pseudarcicella hirudinis]